MVIYELTGKENWTDDDYTPDECNCYWCEKMKELRKVLTVEQEEDDSIEFELQWDDTQKPEPECNCEHCICDEEDLLDIEDEMQAAEFAEILSEEVESAAIEVLYAFETGEPAEEVLKHINNMRDLLQAMEYVVLHE